MRGEVGEQARHDRRRRRGEADEPHAPGAQAAELGEFAGCGIQRRRHRGRVPREHPAGFGEAHARPTRSIERDARAAARGA